MLYSTILLHGEMSSGTYAAAWILYLQSFPRNTTQSRRKLGRFSLFSFMMSRYESKHFLLECPVMAEISSLLYPRWSSFLTRVLRGIWPATRLLLSSSYFPSTMNCMMLPIFCLTHHLYLVLNVGLWLVVDCKVQWTVLFKFTWSTVDKFFQNASWTLLTPSSHHSWNYRSSLEFYGRFSCLRGVWVTYVRPFSSFANLRCSTRYSWFSCLPLKPKCWIAKYQVVFRRNSGVHRPSQPSFHSISSSSSQISASVAFGRVIISFVPKGNGFPL